MRLTNQDMIHIEKIVLRIERMYENMSRQDLMNTLILCHTRKRPLALEQLAKAENTPFWREIMRVMKEMNPPRRGSVH